MRPRPILLLASLLLLLPLPALAQQTSAPPPKQDPETPAKSAKKPKRVWTNDDIESPAPRPRSDADRRRRTSKEADASQEEEPSAEKGRERSDKLPQEKDPEYYEARLAPLRAELSQVESKLYRLQNMPTDYRTGSRVETVGGVAVNSVTIENEIQRLQSRRATLQRKIDEIRAEAERNGLSVR